MPNVLNMMPDFSSDDGTGKEEVKQIISDEGIEEKETPSEPPAEDQPVEQIHDDTDLHKQLQSLQEERTKLLKDIVDLRGQRRDLKQQELVKVQETINELEDVNPDDVVLIEKVLRQKGYITKEESNKMFYKAVEQEELAKFFTKYPEYKPENDKEDLNWGSLQKELTYYRMPDNPHLIGEVLERAHRGIVKTSDRTVPAKKRQIELAGVGAGGSQRSSSGKSLDPRYRDELSRGGWSEEEIKDIEKNLSD